MRRAAYLAAGVAALLILIGTTLWGALPWVLETWGARWIGGHLGVPTPRYTITALSPTRLEIHDLAIGRDEGVIAADSVVLTFDLADRRLDTLIVERARVEVVWRDGSLFMEDIGDLDTLLGPGSGDVALPPRLPVDRLRVTDARLLLRSPMGLVETVVDATVNQDGDTLHAEGNLSTTAPGLAGEVAFALTGDADRPAPWLGISGHAQIDITAREAIVPGLAQGVDGYVGMAVDVQAEGVRVTSLDGLTLTAQSISPDLHPLLPAMLADHAKEGLSLVIAGLPDQPLTALVAPRNGDGLHIAGSGSMSARLGTVTGRLSGTGSAEFDAQGRLMHCTASRVEAVVNGLPALQGLVHASVVGQDIEGRPGAMTLQAEGYVLGENIMHGQFSAPRVRLRATGPAAWQGDVLSAGLTAGHVALDGVTVLPGATLPQGLAWDIAAPPDETAVELDLSPAMAELRASVLVPDAALHVRAQGRDIAGRFGTLLAKAAVPIEGDAAARSLSLTLRDGEIQSGDIAASAVNATLTETAQTLAVEADARFDLLPGEVAPLPDDVQAHRPLRLQVSASLPPEGPVAFSARVRESGLTTILTAEGRHDLDSGRGRASVRVPRLSFGDALQPGDLYAPLAAAALRVEGDAAVQGGVDWTPTALTPHLEMLLDGLTVQRGFIVLRQMHGVVTLTRFWPPRTPAGQVLAVAAIDAGVPFSNAEMTFHLDGKGNAVIEAAKMSLADGTIHADPFTLPLDGHGARTVLHMTGVDLRPLVALADLGGLAASGTLSGEVPVELRQGNVLFHDGMLRSQGPGTIRYRPAAPPAALAAGGGGGVDLMLQALDDFHYQALRLSLEGSAGGDLVVGLHLAGANPELYDGYPLEFNLTLSGALAQIIEGSLSGYQVPDRIRRQLERFGVDR